MRHLLSLAAVGAIAVLIMGEVGAQTSATGNFPKFGTGFTPTTRTLKPINPSAAMTPSGGFKNAAQKPFGVSKVFPKISLGKWPPGGSTGPALSQSPYQSRSTGWNPFAQKK